MEWLMLLLLSPAIFAERHEIGDPNDEPFRPIFHPVYPYNSKLMKRGADRESPQPSPELYAPKIDAKDTYSSSYSNQRDSYYTPGYEPYGRDASPIPAAYPSYYGGDAYAYANSPYAAYAPYSAVPYGMNPASAYPDYYYQPYYYPQYFNPALYQPPTSQTGVDYQATPSQDSAGTEDANKQDDKDDGSKEPKEDGANGDASAGQYVDVGNYVSANTRDLDVQSSTYKATSPYNQVDVEAKSPPHTAIPLPRTTYRVISVAGQPVGPDYPLPAAYVKAQQTERLASQTSGGLAGQGAQRQAGQSYETAGEESVNGGSYGVTYASQDAYEPSYVTVPVVRTKTGLFYVVNADGVFRVDGEGALATAPSSPRPAATSRGKTKYSNVLYVRKPATRTSASHPQPTTTYVVPSSDNRDKQQQRDRATDGRANVHETNYDPSQSYRGGGGGGGVDVPSQPGNKQDYESRAGSYPGKEAANDAPQTRSYSYQYSAYESPDHTTAQQPQQDRISASDDGNFGAKQHNKG